MKCHPNMSNCTALCMLQLTAQQAGKWPDVVKCLYMSLGKQVQTQEPSYLGN